MGSKNNIYSTANFSDGDLKDQGNRLFSVRKYDDAIGCYTKAIVSWIIDIDLNLSFDTVFLSGLPLTDKKSIETNIFYKSCTLPFEIKTLGSCVPRLSKSFGFGSDIGKRSFLFGSKFTGTWILWRGNKTFTKRLDSVWSINRLKLTLFRYSLWSSEGAKKKFWWWYCVSTKISSKEAIYGSRREENLQGNWIANIYQ